MPLENELQWLNSTDPSKQVRNHHYRSVYFCRNVRHLTSGREFNLKDCQTTINCSEIINVKHWRKTAFFALNQVFVMK